MNHERKKIFQELDDPSWYCPTCMFRWGGESSNCPVCGDERHRTSCGDQYLAFYRCSKCKISILQIDVEVKTIDDIQPVIQRKCPICGEQVEHELDSTKKRKIKAYKTISELAEEALSNK